MRCAAPEGAMEGGAGRVRGTAGSKPYANDLLRPWLPGLPLAVVEGGGGGGGADRPRGARRGVMFGLDPSRGASGEGGMTKNDNRTLH